MNSPKKLFAFRLAEAAKATKPTQLKWRIRDGLASASCSGPDFEQEYFSDYNLFGHYVGPDQGVNC